MIGKRPAQDVAPHATRCCDLRDEDKPVIPERLAQSLPDQDRLGVDETGHKNNGKRMWTWCFTAALFTLFRIDPSRGSGVLVEMLGKTFTGVLIAKRPPPSREAQNLANRFRRHGESYFTFVTTPGIEPTNNLTEQAIRFVVIDRKITQGTRSEAGQRWCERIWTTIATCTQQGRSTFHFLADTIHAHFAQRPPPDMLVQNP